LAYSFDSEEQGLYRREPFPVAMPLTVRHLLQKGGDKE
jgi:hypothetical protein